LEEAGCDPCTINRRFTADLPLCPVVDCNDPAVLAAAFSLLSDPDDGCSAGNCCRTLPEVGSWSVMMAYVERTAALRCCYYYYFSGVLPLPLPLLLLLVLLCCARIHPAFLHRYHDTCEPDQVTSEVEDAIHEWEEACEDAGCNTIHADDPDPAVCAPEEDSHDDHEDDHDDHDAEGMSEGTLALVACLGGALVAAIAVAAIMFQRHGKMVAKYDKLKFDSIQAGKGDAVSAVQMVAA
jgi:hypothetical protein